MGSPFVHDLALVLGVAAVTALILRRLAQPAVLGYLAAGLVVGPYLPVPLFADVTRVKALSELGVILVMFSVGIEFRFAKLLRVLPTAGFAGLIQMSALFWIGQGIGRALGWSTVESIFLGASVAISSTMVVSRVFDEADVRAELRELVFGVLVLQDVVAIVLIAVMTAIAKGAGVSGREVVRVVATLGAELVAMVGLGLLVVPRLVRTVARIGTAETRVVVSTGICFTFALLAEELGYSVALGAFVAGMLVAESGRAHDVEPDIVPLRDVFGAVFFVSVGMTVDPRMVWSELPAALLVFVGVVGGQLVSVTAGAVLSGIPLRRAVYAGLSLGQIGEFAFILAAIGVTAGVLRPEAEPILVTVAVLTAFTTPLALRRAPDIVGWLDRRVPARLQSGLLVYAAWFERLRQASPAGARDGLRATMSALALDALGVVLVLTAWRLSEDAAVAGLGARLGLGPIEATLIVASVALLLTLPPLVQLVRNTRRLARTSASLVLGREASGPAGDVWRAALSLLAVLSVGVPAAALLRPVSSYPIALAVVLAVAAGVVTVLWRRASALDQEVRSSLGAALEVLGQTARAVVEDGTGPHPGHPPGPAAELLPPHHVYDLPAEATALVGRSLAQLDLRVRTGATVLAIQRAGQAALVPTGSEVLRAGDRLVVVGSQAALSAVEALLAPGAEGEAPPAAS